MSTRTLAAFGYAFRDFTPLLWPVLPFLLAAFVALSRLCALGLWLLLGDPERAPEILAGFAALTTAAPTCDPAPSRMAALWALIHHSTTVALCLSLLASTLLFATRCLACNEEFDRRISEGIRAHALVQTVSALYLLFLASFVLTSLCATPGGP